jgi:hypothetical protein
MLLGWQNIYKREERNVNYEERRAYMISLRILKFQTRQNLYAYSLI